MPFVASEEALFKYVIHCICTKLGFINWKPSEVYHFSNEDENAQFIFFDINEFSHVDRTRLWDRPGPRFKIPPDMEEELFVLLEGQVYKEFTRDEFCIIINMLK